MPNGKRPASHLEEREARRGGGCEERHSDDDKEMMMVNPTLEFHPPREKRDTPALGDFGKEDGPHMSERLHRTIHACTCKGQSSTPKLFTHLSIYVSKGTNFGRGAWNCKLQAKPEAEAGPQSRTLAKIWGFEPWFPLPSRTHMVCFIVAMSSLELKPVLIDLVTSVQIIVIMLEILL